jgi:hypothetical protein
VTNPHSPFSPAPFKTAVQASHSPVHAVSQHTPSAHWPLVHCDGPVQAAPFARSGMQWPVEISQYEVGTQALSLEHVVKQAVALAHV